MHCLMHCTPQKPIPLVTMLHGDWTVTVLSLLLSGGSTVTTLQLAAQSLCLVCYMVTDGTKVLLCKKDTLQNKNK